MQTLILIAIAGLAAQLVDGSLGMGYGLTSSTLLIFAGLTPAMASASVHLAEVGTTALSGIAHHRFGNVEWHAVRRIAIPGGIGAFLGATFLSSLSTEAAKPLASTLLFGLGVYVLLRFLLGKVRVERKGRPGLRFLAPLGLIGGFIDATGGGGWGPVTTPTLLADGRLAPNRVIGTVSASEFIVALSASIGYCSDGGGQSRCSRYTPPAITSSPPLCTIKLALENRPALAAEVAAWLRSVSVGSHRAEPGGSSSWSVSWSWYAIVCFSIMFLFIITFPAMAVTFVCSCFR